MPDTGALAVHLGHVEPALVVLLAQPFGGDVGRGVNDFALADEASQQTGLREVGNVGGVASVYADGDGGFEFFAADVLDVDAGGFFEGNHGFVEANDVGVGEGTINGDNGAGEFAGNGAFQETAGRVGESGHGHVFGRGSGFCGRCGFFGRGSGFCGRCFLSCFCGCGGAAAGCESQGQEQYQT